MEFLKNIFGDRKPEYADRIPERLTATNFDVHDSFHHGFPYQPSCMSHDTVQQIIAIGSHQGNIVILGKSGLERHFTHPKKTSILQLVIVQNKGLLISRCDDNILYLWDLNEKLPFVKHKLEFQKEVPCLVSCPYESDWFYVGMEGGSVNIVQTNTLELSGCTIHWNKVVLPSGSRRNRPGDVIAIEENPQDHSKLLLAYTEGLCAIWNLKTKTAEKRFHHNTSSIAVLMTVSWNSSGRQFAGGYSDGSIAIFNMKIDLKPEKVFYPHGSVSGNSPIFQLQWFNTEPEPYFIFSGGYPEGDGFGKRSITIHNSRTTNLLSFTDSIINFLCLPSTPFITDIQQMNSLVVLTENDLIMHDLQSQSFPTFTLPFSFDVHTSPVTTLHYCGKCPDDFVAELQSVLSKMPQKLKSIKRWPLRGGKWGKESPDPWTDLIVTGHANGCVRLWFCRSVIMQPLFTIDTTKYLKPRTPEPKPRIPEPKPDPNPITTPEDEENVESMENKGSPKLKKKRNISHFIQKRLRTRNSKEEMNVDSSMSIEEVTPTTQIDEEQLKEIEEEVKQKPSELPIRNEKPSRKISLEVTSPKSSSTVKSPRESKTPSTRKSTGALPESVTTPPNPTTTSRKYSMSSKSSNSIDDYVVFSINSELISDEMGMSSINELAINPHSQTLILANCAGHVLVFDFSLKHSHRDPQSLEINFGCDSVVPDKTEGKDMPPIQSECVFCNEIDQQLPGFHVIQHCFCFHDDMGIASVVDVTCLQYSVQNGILAIGTNRGLSIIDTKLNQCLKTLGHIESILYLADPNAYTRQVRRVAQERLDNPVYSKQFSFSGDVKPHRRLSMELSINRKISTPLLYAKHYESQMNINLTKEGMECEQLCNDETINCVEIVQMFVNKSGAPSLTLWVGTKYGRVSVYIINCVENTRQTGRYKNEILPTGIVIENKSATVNMIFLSAWGEKLITPYKPKIDGDASPALVTVVRRTQSGKEVSETEKPVNYVIITTRDMLKCIGFPGNQVISIVEPNISGGLIVDSAFFTCEGLPCVCTWTTTGLILIHSLPGLKPMLQTEYKPLLDFRVLYTFQVSVDGQAIYQTTPSEFQRLSLITPDNLNLPYSLPDVYVTREGPQPAKKGLLGAMFKPGGAIDRNEFFGLEAAGKPWKSVAKRDGSNITWKEDKRGATGGGRGGGPQTAFEKARKQLDERGERLSEIQEQTEKLATDATDFAGLARLVAEKQKRKRLF